MIKLLELNPKNIEIYLEQLLAIEQEAFAEPWTRADYLEEAGRPIAHLLALVDDDWPEPKLLGYAGFWQVVDEADINNVAIAADCRGRGYGRQLLQGVLALARLLGCVYSGGCAQVEESSGWADSTGACLRSRLFARAPCTSTDIPMKMRIRGKMVP